MDMDQVGHFVRQRRVFIGISVLLAAVYFFCLDLKTLAIFSVDTKIEDSAWVNGILISLWAYYLYRFRVARLNLGDAWRVKAAMLEQAGRFVQKYAAPSLARKENIEKARKIIALPPAPVNWNIELNLASLSGGPETTKFTAGRMYRKANVHWKATSLSEKTSGTTLIELAYG
ncbi:MAG: hypothetical protein IIA98_03755, partial [Proteobacteria bacterium]|nr:hypothetical protein [Pseudomonadota bacterium]